MRIKVEVETAQYKYLAYFDAYADAQDMIADFLRKCLHDDVLRKMSLDALMEIADHYQREFETLYKMPYYCENENGILIADLLNRATYKVSLTNDVG